MKLTLDQISKIEETLVLNGIQYDDIKLELTDHIASEIEDKISINGISYEIAKDEVFQNWRYQMKPSSSFWVGLIYSSPKIVMDRWESTTKRQQFQSLFFSVMPTLGLIGIFKIYNNSAFIDNAVQCLSLVLFFLIIYYRVIIWKSKRKTSFSLMFGRNSNLILFYLMLLGIGIAPLRMNEISICHNIIGAFLISWFFVYLFFNLQLAFKHFQFVKKLKLS
ncbi:hypothetical protein [Flavobacterium sp. N3904]|uniref:hypothetical protein n=1 Tax=Flavobacterium sp. N3904 TaxID=2986835 RepID=UPI002224C32F|nr:hypothetical protein [Flavobacterium sp. N3904]